MKKKLAEKFLSKINENNSLNFQKKSFSMISVKQNIKLNRINFH